MTMESMRRFSEEGGPAVRFKEKKIKPLLRGEVWETFQLGEVTLLERVRSGFLVALDNGKVMILFPNEFKKRIRPPVSEVSQ